MREAKTYIQKPVEITAFQFLGYRNAEEICTWIPGTFFVPQGYEHRMRTKHEHDRSNGHILDSAEPFLIVEQREGITMGDPRADTRTRVDLYMWIVKDLYDRVVVMGDVEFKSLYDEKDEFQNNTVPIAGP